MCYLNLTIKTKKIAKKELEVLENALMEKMVVNPDGFATLFDNKILIRTCDNTLYYTELYNHLYNSAWGWALTHYRNGTSGEAGDKNIHLWQKDGFFFAHNGFANGVGEKADKGACDSLLFFNQFLAHLNGQTDRGHIIGALKKLENKFMGRAIMVDPTGLLWLMGDFKCYKTKSLIVISSCEIDLSENINYGDLSFSGNGILTSALDGLYSFDGEIFKKEAKFEGSYYYNYNPYQQLGIGYKNDRYGWTQSNVK